LTALLPHLMQITHSLSLPTFMLELTWYDFSQVHMPRGVEFTSLYHGSMQLIRSLNY
jgi:hypothetical protein